MPKNGPSLPGTNEDTGPIPAVGIPEKYQKECAWGDVPIYCCQHCRENGTFQVERFNFRSAEDLRVQLQAALAPNSRVSQNDKTSSLSAGTEPGHTDADGKYIRSEAPRIAGPFLTDWQTRRILEGMGIELNRNPADEAFQRGLFGKGRRHGD